MSDYIQINRKDNVAVAMRDLSKGELICGVTLADDIPVGHKFSLRNIEKGEDKLSVLIEKLIKDKRTDDVLKVTQDKEYRQKLYREYHVE